MPYNGYSKNARVQTTMDEIIAVINMQGIHETFIVSLLSRMVEEK